MEGSLVAYKVFTNGSVLNASEINDNLMNQSVMVFSNSTARSAALTSPVAGMVTFLEDTSSYESYDGTSWIGFGGGSGILQVVSITKTDTTSISLASGAISSAVSNLTATITPTSVDSKILILSNLSTDGPCNTILYRDGSVLTGATGELLGSRTRITTGAGASSGNNVNANAANYLDSPATTTAISYTIRLHNSGNSTQTLYVNRSGTDGSLTQLSRAISTITLMEVAG
jgi:hypothetical protein